MLKLVLISIVYVGSSWNVFAGISQANKSQGQRIENGVKSGELTEIEAARLDAGQEKIGRKSERFEQAKDDARADGHVDSTERRKLMSQKANLRRTQLRQSKQIYNKKHNNRSR